MADQLLHCYSPSLSHHLPHSFYPGPSPAGASYHWLWKAQLVNIIGFRVKQVSSQQHNSAIGRQRQPQVICKWMSRVPLKFYFWILTLNSIWFFWATKCYFSFDVFQPLKKVDKSLSLWAIQNQAIGWIWPVGSCWPALTLVHISKEQPEISMFELNFCPESCSGSQLHSGQMLRSSPSPGKPLYSGPLHFCLYVRLLQLHPLVWLCSSHWPPPFCSLNTLKPSLPCGLALAGLSA